VESPGFAGVTTSGIAAIASEPGVPLAQSGTESPFGAPNAQAANNKPIAADFTDMASLFLESIHAFISLFMKESNSQDYARNRIG